MCGICGAMILGPAGSLDEQRLRTMRDRMARRGPDGKGEWTDAQRRAWLGHRRLAIIDLSDRGLQPMLSADGRIAVVFNGEIYNFRALRAGLEAEGVVFRSDSDTEVIIHLYARLGPAFVSKLRGMFAIGLWDAARGSLLLARDPYGIKPLYYADSGGLLTFASSVKALMTDPRLSAEVDAAGLVGFYVFGSVPEPYTIRAAVRALPAGTSLVVEADGRRRETRFHHLPRVLAEAEDLAPAAGGAIEGEAREALLDSVRHHLVADVPVGAFLSSGVDSGALVGLMRDAGQESIRTVTLSYAELEGQAADEAPLAAEVARHYGTEHTTRRVTASEFAADFPALIEEMDQPSVDGVNAWFVSKAAHELGLKVALSGVGGDELLGGYDTFRKVPRMARLLSAPGRVGGLAPALAWSVGAARRMGVGLHPKSAGVLRYGGTIAGAYLLQRALFLPEEVGEVIGDPAVVRAGIERLAPADHVASVLAGGPSRPFGQVAALESCLYLRNQLLRDADWAGMAHSLELRTPLVDHVLLERLAPHMARPDRPSGKTLLGHAPRRALPEQVMQRRKTGFSIPVQSWVAAIGSGGGVLPGSERIWARGWARKVAGLQRICQDGAHRGLEG